ncbi:MAG: OprO/OprP family phosphate-selective porin [Bacteroidales bacterium]|nr:OprO/OprP family phosphate-selective porin [Bacteroidales bacterium]
MRIAQFGLSALIIVTISVFSHGPALAQDSGSFHLEFDLAGSYQLSNGDENATAPLSGAFRARDFRLDMKGSINDRLYYRFRQNLRKPFAAGSLDSFAKGTDMAFVGYSPCSQFAVEAGKICQHWGGFDYDEVPLYIYQYSDYMNHIDIFYAGVDFIWRPSEVHEFVFELSDPTNDLIPARYPLSTLLNWNARFGDGRVLTRCAIGGMTLGNGKYAKLLNGGIKFNYPHFQWYADFMLEKDGADRVGIATFDLGAAALSGKGEIWYNSKILKAFWQFAPGWNLVVKGCWDDVAFDSGGRYRSSFLGLCSLEYYPVESQDLRFFICGTAHHIMFNGPSLPSPFTTARAEIGLIYKLRIL